jgi:hypothetical protein
VDSTGVIHVVWDESPIDGNTPYDTGYTSSRDGGQSWQQATIFSYPDWYNVVPIIAADSRGGLLMVGRRAPGNTKWYRLSQDGGLSWSEPADFPAPAGVGGHDIASDSGGEIHLVTEGSASVPRGGVQVFYNRWDGYRWSPAVSISERVARLARPKIAISEGNRLHVVAEGSDQGPSDIYYMTSTSSAPYQTPVPQLPTPTATRSPTPTAVSVPASSTPTATRMAVLVSSTELPTSTSLDQTFPSVVSTLTVLGLLSTVVFARLWTARRRG